MSAQQLGFGSSLKMLTRDKGWLKPVMILALVGWIPIVGQIAILGYGYEWARLTAWGVDAAPKQRGVDYGKLMTSGGRAFAVIVLMSIVLACLTVIVPVLGVGAVGILAAVSPFGAAALFASGAFLVGLVGLVIGTLANTFMSVCALRATIYDRFAAGWRVDRVFQMIGRDPGGFLHVFVVSLVANLLPVAFSVVAGILAVIFASVGVMGVGYTSSYYFGDWSVFPVGTVMGITILAVVLAILAVFVYECFSVVAQLVSINAVGQWVQRFDVGRWGTSSDPLPSDVPHKGDGGSGASPLPPSEAEAAQTAPVEPQVDPQPAPQPPVEADAPAGASGVDAGAAADAAVTVPMAAAAAAAAAEAAAAAAEAASEPAGVAGVPADAADAEAEQPADAPSVLLGEAAPAEADVPADPEPAAVTEVLGDAASQAEPAGEAVSEAAEETPAAASAQSPAPADELPTAVLPAADEDEMR